MARQTTPNIKRPARMSQATAKETANSQRATDPSAQ